MFFLCVYGLMVNRLLDNQPLNCHLYDASDILSVLIIFNVFGFDRISHLPYQKSKRYVTVAGYLIVILIVYIVFILYVLILGPLCQRHRDLMSQNPIFSNTNIGAPKEGPEGLLSRYQLIHLRMRSKCNG